MTFSIYESGQHVRRVVCVRDTFQGAIDAAHDLFQIAWFERDEENFGCADMITKFGSIYVIEPTARSART